jgi:putative peptidoglycan lipid II flippase
LVKLLIERDRHRPFPQEPDQPDGSLATGDGSAGSPAFFVGAGILISRIFGLIRDRIFAHFFGNSDAADAFKAAFRIPNLLQNLFGEGSLSASFIPVYAKLLAEKNLVEARQVAAGIATTIGLLISLCVAVGVLITPILIMLIAPGFVGEKRDLTIRLVRILFPGAGLLVYSAWCLGILNSHRRFFLSYAAPVLWNLVIIVALAWFGNQLGQFPLAVVVAWASVLGSAVQCAIQLPLVLKLTGRLPLGFHWKRSTVKTVIHNFVPVAIARGVVQISAYVDELLASLLPSGSFAALSYAQTLYLLPVSLFGMSVSASELPLLSSALGDKPEIDAFLRHRLTDGLQRIAFLIVPSAMAFLALGDVIAAAIYQTGRFSHADATYVWGILAGASIGLLASTLGRLYSSAYYALHDTRTPLRYAVLRVCLTAGLGYLFALRLPLWIGIPERWGVAFLSASAGIAGWVEFTLLRRTLNQRIGSTGLSPSILVKLWLAAGLAAGCGFGLKQIAVLWHPITQAALVFTAYGLIYFAVTALLRVSQALNLWKWAVGRLR